MQRVWSVCGCLPRKRNRNGYGKAKLLRDDYCDGLGDCLPACPTGAITFVEREAAAYDEEAVLANQRKKEAENKASHHLKRWLSGKPYASDEARTKLRQLKRWSLSLSSGRYRLSLCRHRLRILKAQNCLSQQTVLPMPMQIFIRILSERKVVLVGCPKLDSVDYSEKLEEIIQSNNISSVTVVRMEVPCCGGLEMAAKKLSRTAENSFRGRLLQSSLTEKFWTETTKTTKLPAKIISNKHCQF